MDYAGERDSNLEDFKISPLFGKDILIVGRNTSKAFLESTQLFLILGNLVNIS